MLDSSKERLRATNALLSLAFIQLRSPTDRATGRRRWKNAATQCRHFPEGSQCPLSIALEKLADIVVTGHSASRNACLANCRPVVPLLSFLLLLRPFPFIPRFVGSLDRVPSKISFPNLNLILLKVRSIPSRRLCSFAHILVTIKPIRGELERNKRLPYLVVVSERIRSISS